MSKPKESLKVIVSTPVHSTVENLHVNGVNVLSGDLWQTYLSDLRNTYGLTIHQSESWEFQLRQLANEGLVSAIEFEILAFKQGKNENNFAFNNSELDFFGKSFTNKPFLRNHDQQRIESRDGTIIASHNDNGAFKQHIKLTTEQGIKDFIQGRIDRFSIGWKFDTMTCSICGLDYLDFDCMHTRGRKYGDLGTCNIVFNKPEGIETSAVNVPAVSGTHILSLSDIDNKKSEVIFMDKTDDIVEQEEHVLAADDGVIATSEQDKLDEIANELHLGDMDGRIAKLEEVISEIYPVISQLNANVEQLQEQNNEMAILLAKFNGDLPPQYQSEASKRLSWGGYGGSKLNITGSTPKPTRNIREPHKLQHDIVAEHNQTSRIVAPKNATPKQKAGAAALNAWNKGGD